MTNQNGLTQLSPIQQATPLYGESIRYSHINEQMYTNTANKMQQKS
jgi:hypothetical protein